jgi:hypothetical protein
MAKKGYLADYSEIEREFMKKHYSYSFTAATHLNCLNAATLLNYFCFWTLQNKANGLKTNNDFHFKQGRFWTYDSVAALSKKFPLSEKQILTAISNLEKEGLIVSAILNENKFSREKWYSATQKGIDLNSNTIFIQADKRCLLVDTGEEVFYGLGGEKVEKKVQFGFAVHV